jgi:excisionase family DNA binding protein
VLNVSWPFLIKLLEDGGIPHRKVGKHRRVRMENVMSYKAEPPRVYRRVICSTARRPYRACSGLHRTPPLLLRVGRNR